jgi:hypothetical protein
MSALHQNSIDSYYIVYNSFLHLINEDRGKYFA